MNTQLALCKSAIIGLLVGRRKRGQCPSSFSFTKFSRQSVLAAAMLGLTVGAIGRTEASQIFMIDDMVSPITVTNTGTISFNGVTPLFGAESITLLGDSTPDFIHFTFLIEGGVVSPFTFSDSTDLLDPVTLALSDRLLLNFTQASGIVDVRFDSRMPVTLLLGNNNTFDVIEVDDGSFQFLRGYGVTVDSVQLAAVNFFARSEPHGAVPEPASLALLGIGLAGLGAMRCRKT